MNITWTIFKQLREQINKENKLQTEDFAQNVNALVSLIADAMASGPVCSIVTPRLEPKERAKFFANLSKENWTAETAQKNIPFGNYAVNYDIYTVRRERTRVSPVALVAHAQS